MISGTLLYPDFTSATAPELAQRTVTLRPLSTGPHTAQASTIGNSSIHVMLRPSSITCDVSVPLHGS